jgi:hypothetical protein
MHATGFSRPKVSRLLERGPLPFQVFAGTRCNRNEDPGDLLRGDRTTQGTPS